MISDNKGLAGKMGTLGGENAYLNNNLPPIIIIVGHYSSGKTTFSDEVQAQMAAGGMPAVEVINYKTRPLRGTELPDEDYIRVTPDEMKAHQASGRVAVVYEHDERSYGISREYADAIQKGQSPIIVTDAMGLKKFITHLQSAELRNPLYSFMLHTTPKDAQDRLIRRVVGYSEAEIREIKEHMRGQEKEFAIYREHEYLFRHVFRNETLEGVDKAVAMRHLGSRAIDILGLEGRLNASSAEDFRELYVDEIVRKLFEVPGKELLENINQGVVLKIPEQALDAYARAHNEVPLEKSQFSQIPIVSADASYGILSICLKATKNQDHKRRLVDLIAMATGVTHQYAQPEVHLAGYSTRTLKQMPSGGLVDFYISFSPFDPMSLPRIDARLHTVAFEGIETDDKLSISPMTMEKARKIVEGNGNSRLNTLGLF